MFCRSMHLFIYGLFVSKSIHLFIYGLFVVDLCIYSFKDCLLVDLWIYSSIDCLLVDLSIYSSMNCLIVDLALLFIRRFFFQWISAFIYHQVLGGFAPIFYVNCKRYVYSLYTLRKTRNFFCKLYKIIVDFQNLMQIEFCWMQIKKFWSSINLP